jgi:hypothetical protein
MSTKSSQYRGIKKVHKPPGGAVLVRKRSGQIENSAKIVQKGCSQAGVLILVKK